jgi:hypothetical protein
MKGVAIKYTQAQLDFIKANSSLPRKETTQLVNEKFGTDFSVINIHALCKRKGWLTGRDGKFKKGQKYNPNSGAKSANKTSFKKGGVPHNHRPVGSERISKDGYVEIKVAEPRKWMLKHRYLWQQINGDIPKSHIVIFEDGDNRNFEASNLRLISCAEHAVINKNKLREVIPAARPAAITLGQLMYATRKAAA